MRTVSDIVCREERPGITALPRPEYRIGHSANGHSTKLFMGVSIFERHMTDEGYQLQLGMSASGYVLTGNGLTLAVDDTREVVELNPEVVILQDKREWDIGSDICWDKNANFKNIELLRSRDDIFKVTVLKDSQHNPEYHMESAREIGCHAWIIYYHPEIVTHLAPYVRPEHVIRTYHMLNPNDVPGYSSDRLDMAILSGATNSDVYPMRTRLYRSMGMPNVYVKCHPGYKPRGHRTPEYLRELSRFKVAICTSSKYGYALRKIIEAAACGCKVITDLPRDEVMPEIEDAIVRVEPTISAGEVSSLVDALCREYDSQTHAAISSNAIRFYSYTRQCAAISERIESMRHGWK